MAEQEAWLLMIARVARDTSMRGEGLSLRAALARSRYKELRPTFAASDLLPVVRAYPELIEEWLSYSEDKRTNGGWYMLRDGVIGTLDEPRSEFAFTSLEQAASEYIVRELDFWATTDEPR